MSTVRLKNVTVAFDQIPLFEGLNLSFADGEKVVIHGESGSGASVLMKLISGIIEPVSGEVILDGIKLTYAIDKRFFEQRRHISHMLEDLQPIANLSAFDNLALYYRLNTDYAESEIRGIVTGKLRSVNLEEKGALRPAKMSRDDQIILCVLMNLKDQTGLAVVDEVFFNLKDASLARIKEIIVRKVNDRRTTLIMRDVDEGVLRIAPTRRITLKKGTIVSDEVAV